MRVLLFIYFVLLFSSFASAQENTVLLSTFSTGFGSVSGDSSAIQGSAGQIFVGDVGGDSTSTGSGFFAGFAATNTTVSLSIATGWNLISVPATVSDYQKSMLFGTAVSEAFTYNNGYVSSSTLANGIGYWLKFDADQIASVAGTRRDLDTISVVTGWNMIGSISDTVGVAGIGSISPGIVTSSFFEYIGSYISASQIEPGKGYWVKVNQDGKLILSASGLAHPSNRIRIVPTQERPPAPPNGEKNSKNPTIPVEFSLGQNFPNPFNPSTTIEFAIATPVFTSLKIYDVLGRDISTVVSERLEPGIYRRVWNGVNAGSGLYFYKLTAGSFTSVKKLLLIK